MSVKSPFSKRWLTTFSLLATVSVDELESLGERLKKKLTDPANPTSINPTPDNPTPDNPTSDNLTSANPTPDERMRMARALRIFLLILFSKGTPAHDQEIEPDFSDGFNNDGFSNDGFSNDDTEGSENAE